METGGKILMICGGLLSVVVAGLVSLMLARQPATVTVLSSPQASAAVAQPNTAPVLIAVSFIPRNTLIHAGDVPRLFKQVYEPKGAVATGTVFSDPAQLSALLAAVPRHTIATIQPGEQLAAPLLSGLALPSGAGTLAGRLPGGYDGETISVDAPVKAVDGAIAVNDRVDVIYSRPARQGSGRYSALLIQNATVVATGPISNTYTLALRPADALRLAYVQDEGWSLHLALRSAFDGNAVWKAPVVAQSSLGR